MKKRLFMTAFVLALGLSFGTASVSALASEKADTEISENKEDKSSDEEALKVDGVTFKDIDKDEIPAGEAKDLKADAESAKEEKEASEEVASEEEKESEEMKDTEEAAEDFDREKENKDKKDKANKKAVVKKKKAKAKKDEEKKPVISFTEEELKMLACVIYLEAGNQPFEGKVAVANTIINRVKGKGFPNTIDKVIHHVAYGRYQFGLAVPGGKLEKAMKVYGKRTVWWQKKYEKEATKAAKAALYGEKAIPDHLCFFVMKNSAPGLRFRKTKPGGVIIKDHYFYKW